MSNLLIQPQPESIQPQTNDIAVIVNANMNLASAMPPKAEVKQYSPATSATCSCSCPSDYRVNASIGNGTLINNNSIAPQEYLH